jgi:hypothetical protein
MFWGFRIFAFTGAGEPGMTTSGRYPRLLARSTTPASREEGLHALFHASLWKCEFDRVVGGG